MINSKPIYVYKEQDLFDFWEQSGKYYWEIMFYSEKIESKRIEDWLNDTVRHTVEYCTENYLFNNYLFDIIWWLNLVSICVHDRWLYNNTEENRQWIFDTPDHPFEKYLFKKGKKEGIDVYNKYETRYLYKEININNKCE